MDKYRRVWYVVQSEQDTKNEYLIGYIAARLDAEESKVIEAAQEYCKEKQYRLVTKLDLCLLPIVNMVYPFEPNEEAMTALEYVISAEMEERKGA